MSSLSTPVSGGHREAVLDESRNRPNINQQFSESETLAPEMSTGPVSSSANSPREPSILKKAWRKLGITPVVVVFMVKPSLAVVLGAAIYQKHTVAAQYMNFGYLIMIISLLSVPMLPRGKFLVNTFITALLVCFAAAMVLFGQWCAIKARQNSTPKNASVAVARGYNSSAAAVNAIFLIVNIFGISVLRAARPAFSVPSVVYTVFVLVGFIYGPQEFSYTHSRRFVRELLFAFLTGQGLSTGVSLIVIPVSSRKVFFGETTGFLQTCRGLLRAHQDFIETLEHSSPCKTSKYIPRPGERPAAADESSVQNDQTNLQSKATTSRKIANDLLGLAAKLREDVVYAKREIAYGNLGSGDIHQIHQLLRSILLPITGLSTLADMSERLIAPSRAKDLSVIAKSEEAAEIARDEQASWHKLVMALHPSFAHINQVLDQGIQHILILLKLIPRPQTATNNIQDNGDGDLEKGLQIPKPGDIGFGQYLEQQINESRQTRTAQLQLWAEERGFTAVFHTSAGYWSSKQAKESADSDVGHLRVSQRLHIVLYMEYLLYSVSSAILDTVRYAEAKVEDGTMTKQRLVFPTLKIIKKLIRGLVRGENSSADVDNLDHAAGDIEILDLGDSRRNQRDAEHLPPKTTLQRLGNHIRRIPQLLGSDSAKFGLRVVVAVMSIAIMAYLKKSRPFFIRQRIVWGLVMIAIGMSPTSGSAVFNLLGNLIATLFGMIGAFINWYIVDQKTAGVIVLLFFFMMLYFYVAARNQRFLVAIVAGAVTHILIVGNELQVRVLGLKLYTATGQAYYPFYELAPYRLLVVGGGCLVAYIWTIFPVPITEGSVLRRDLGGSLFLLASYVSSVTSSVDESLHKPEGDSGKISNQGARLGKTRHNILAKEIMLLNSMKQNLAFMAFEPRLGGEFPKKTYEAIIKEVQNVTSYLTIIAYASEAFTTIRNAPASSTSRTWLEKFTSSRYRSDNNSHKISSLLVLLSASIRNNQPLPPYTKTPRNSNLATTSQEKEADSANAEDTTPLVLGLQNIDEPGFRAVAVIDIAHECLLDSVSVVVSLVKELVGELDFTYRGLEEMSERASFVDNDSH